jgi:dienelactone hydrolase
MRGWIRHALPFLVTAAVACGTPGTDIVATTTEDVGDFHVRSSDSNGAVTGDVCIEKAAHADEIVRRILQQLANHSYRAVTLNVYSRDRAIASYHSTPGGTERRDLPATSNPCTNEEARITRNTH